VTAPLHTIRRDIVRVCAQLDRREYVGGRDGNVSVRLGDAVLVTRAGVRKGDVTEDDLLRVRADGTKTGGRGEPSTETGMHLRIYALRPDAGAVVHAHPPVATGFAAAGRPIDECVLPEVIVGLGRVPLARYATPGTPELSASLDPVIASHDAILLENHGVVTVGADVWSAYQRMENVEHAARILLVASLLGGPNPLSVGQVSDLIGTRSRYGVREGLAGCRWAAPDAAADVPGRTTTPGPSSGPGASSSDASDDAAMDRIVERVVARLRDVTRPA
jgi:L-fuculose-phosphate aldolase